MCKIFQNVQISSAKSSVHCLNWSAALTDCWVSWASLFCQWLASPVTHHTQKASNSLLSKHFTNYHEWQYLKSIFTIFIIQDNYDMINLMFQNPNRPGFCCTFTELLSWPLSGNLVSLTTTSLEIGWLPSTTLTVSLPWHVKPIASFNSVSSELNMKQSSTPPVWPRPPWPDEFYHKTFSGNFIQKASNINLS